MKVIKLIIEHEISKFSCFSLVFLMLSAFFVLYFTVLMQCKIRALKRENEELKGISQKHNPSGCWDRIRKNSR